MWPIAADMWHGPSVCLSVCDVMDRYPAKTAAPIEMTFGMWGGVGPVSYTHLTLPTNREV